MRVVGGTLRGMKLKAPRGRAVRPTADRVKEALFNIVGPRVVEAVVLDLFAGSGALGIEALSRGAAFCYFVERERRHLAVIRENLEKTGLTGKAALLGREVAAALDMLAGEGVRADLILMDPPYGRPLIVPVLQSIKGHNLLREGGLVAVEHAATDRKWAEKWTVFKSRRYGDTVLTFIDGSGLAASPAVKESEAQGAEQVKHRRHRHQEAEE